MQMRVKVAKQHLTGHLLSLGEGRASDFYRLEGMPAPCPLRQVFKASSPAYL